VERLPSRGRFCVASQNENFGNTPGEAVAAGTPVVSRQVRIAPLLADVAGLVVAHDAAALALAWLVYCGNQDFTRG